MSDYKDDLIPITCIFTIVVKKTSKYPKRIKTHSEGTPVNFVYQENFTEYENHVLAAQEFSKIKNSEWLYYGNKTKNGYVFIHMESAIFFEKSTVFLKNENYKTIASGAF